MAFYKFAYLYRHYLNWNIKNDPGLTEADRRVSEAMMKMWAQFAKTGDPNVEGMVQWPVYNKGEDKFMYIADPVEIKSGFSKIKP